jgi:photosystem II stability/assembly factor-like uncharacterized protein
MKRLAFSRLILCVLCGASISLLIPALAFAGWVAQTSGTTKVLMDVCFPGNVQTGYIVGCDFYSGNGPVILKTTNGGANWLPQTPPDTMAGLWGVDFPVDAVTGYTVGGLHGASYILKTTNGGATWVSQNPRGGNKPLRRVQFPVDAQTGYAVGGYDPSAPSGSIILKTTDGGANWVSQSSGDTLPLWGVNFPVDANTGYVVGGTIDTTLGGKTGFILKTTNGGANWVTQLSGVTKMFSDVSFPVDPMTGFAAIGEGTRDSGIAGFMKTTNGGANWTWIRDSLDIASICFPVDANTGYAVGGMGPSSARIHIMKTTNGGASWPRQPPGTTVFLAGVNFPVDARTGWVVGDSGTILKTTDGGIGVEEENKGFEGSRVQGFKITPNPFTYFATLPGHEAERFSLYDVSGRQVGTYQGDRIGEGLGPGVYFLKGMGNAGAAPVRIVKVR